MTARRARSARTGRFAGLLVVAGVALGPVAACHNDGPKAGAARLVLDGQAQIVRQAGKHELLTSSTDVHVGDEVTLVKGTGVLHLNGGPTMELRSGLSGAKASQLVMGPVPVLEAGDVLVTATEGTDLTADQTKVHVSGGSARVSRAVGMDVTGYDGNVALDSAGQKRTVPTLREMQVPALGLPPAAPQPLLYRPADPWDRRFLSDAIDLGQRLQALAAGYTSNLSAGDGHTTAFYIKVLPDLANEPAFTADLLDPNRSPGETLVGAAIAELGKRGTFVDRWHSVFAFRDEGAAWGLVALDQGVDRTPLLGAVSSAVQNSPLAIGPLPSQNGPSIPASTPTTSIPTGSQPTTTTTRPPTTTTTAPPASSGGGGLLSPVLDPVTNLLSGVLKALLGGLLGG